MKSILKLFLPLMVIALAVLPFSQAKTVEAASTFKDGEYTIPFTVLKSDGSGGSETNKFINQSAKLIVKDGKNVVQMTLKEASWWKNFTVGSSGVTTISEGNNTRVVQVAISNLNQPVNAAISVDVPDVYAATHDVKLKFDVSNVPIANGSASGATTKAETNPPTGDHTPIILFSVALVASGLVLGRKLIFR